MMQQWPPIPVNPEEEDLWIGKAQLIGHLALKAMNTM